MSIKLNVVGDGNGKEEPKPQPNPVMVQRAQEIERVGANLSGVKKIIGIYSGKGGVGKTTVAVNLAALAAKQGHKVGLLDADIDCPNVNAVLGINEKLDVRPDTNQIVPVNKFDMKVISMASLQANVDEAIVWRGPLLTSAISQFLEKADWDELDYLFVDLPPGTSDVPLTLLEIAPIDGYVIITTPQKLACLDAKKSANMIKRLEKQVVGIVENMSGDQFGSGGGEKTAKELEVEFLGEIEFSKELMVGTDKGKPAILSDSNMEKVFEKLLTEIDSKVEL